MTFRPGARENTKTRMLSAWIFSCGTIFPECPALFRVCNVATFGMSEVGVAQLVVDGVKLIIAMEKRLEAGGDIDHLVPTQK